MRIFTVLLVLLLTIGLLSCEDKKESEPPVGVFTVTPTSGPFTQIFTFNATKSYDNTDDNDNLQVRWDFDGDGIFDTEYSSTKTIEHQYDEADDYTVILEVLNSEGWTDTEWKSLVVFADSIPPIASFYIEPDSSSTQTIFLFNAGTSTDQYTPVEELRFRWDWEGDGSWDTPYISDSTFYHKYDESGIFRAILEVKNNITLTDTTSRIVTVYDL